MKILLYNFVQPAELGRQGGGVAVYHGNLIAALVREGHEVISLSSGDRYTVRERAPFLKQNDEIIAEGKVTRVYIYNSPFIAPAHSSFYELDIYSESRALDHIPAELRQRFGDIDVLHFQNIEGLTAAFFEVLRQEFAQARMLLSSHNYNLVCPQVNLWFRETMICEDYRNGHACINCIGGHGANPHERNIRRMDSLIAALGVRRHGTISKAVEYAIRLPLKMKRWALRKKQALRGSRQQTSEAAAKPLIVASDTMAAPYARFRARNIELVRKTFDRVLAVSNRTKTVLVRNGLPEHAIDVSYIGTAHYDKFLSARRVGPKKGRLHIAYLGYMRADKGFFFFMECLHLLREDVARDIDITIAARYADGWVLAQLKATAQKFGTLNLYNGYSHHSLDAILETVSLGIIPVLWEDNLPQVAIEMVCRGIPILTADRGGASEIASNPAFTFKSGSKQDFLTKLDRIAKSDVDLQSFWDHEMKIYSMKHHVDELMRYYARRE